MPRHEQLTVGELQLGDAPMSTKVTLMGAGTSGNRETTSLADKNHMEFRLESKATSGDNRGVYLRYYLNGIGNGGEAMRIFTTVETACGTAHGAHISLSCGGAGAGGGTGVGSGSLSGLGVAMRATLHILAGANTGTLAPVQGEIWLDDATSAVPAGSHSLFRGVVGGDVTLVANVKNVIELAGVKVTDGGAGVADMITTGCADATSDARMKIRVNGVDMWIMLDTTIPVAD